MEIPENILELLQDEVRNAQKKFKPFNSAHEGYAVIKEEVDELWDEVKKNRGTQLNALAEALQIAAMAIRYMIDIPETDNNKN